jgi:predicted transcriptional regulator
MYGERAGRQRREPGGLEAEVLAVLTTAGRRLTPAEVRGRLDGSLAYTTVMTTLARLHEKGVIGRLRVGRAYAYAPLDSPTVAARRMCRALDGAESREVALARFVAELDPSDVPILRRLLTPAHDGESAPGRVPVTQDWSTP